MPRRGGGGSSGGFARTLIPKMKQIQAERPGAPLTVDEMAMTLKSRFRWAFRLLQKDKQKAKKAAAAAQQAGVEDAAVVVDADGEGDDDFDTSDLQPSKRSRLTSTGPSSPSADTPSTTDDRARKKKSKSAARQLMDSISQLSDPNARKKKVFPVEQSSTTLEDLGGLDHTISVVRSTMDATFRGAYMFKHLGFEPPKGLLLHGPPGCGKTLLASAIAGEWEVPFIKVSAPELIGGTSGDSEQFIRDLFEQAIAIAQRDKRGCIVFLDEIDTITSKRENAQREMERRIVAQLMTTMDNLSLENTGGSPVLVIGATTRPDALDPAIRRTGRFDTEVALSVPDIDARAHILAVICRNKRIDAGVDFANLAKRTPGFVGADLMSLANQACLNAVLTALAAQDSGDSDGNGDGDGVVAAETKKGVKEEAASNSVGGADAMVKAEMKEEASAARSDAGAGAGVGSTIDTNADTTADTAADTTADRAADTAGPKQEAAGDGDGDGQDLSVVIDESMDAEPTIETITLDDVTEDTAAQFMELQHLQYLSVTTADFEAALKRVQPSATREGFATTPSVTWDDVGALGGPRRELEEAIKFPLQAPELCASVGIRKPPGVLLYGPPGCGKTLLAKALANSCNANFISIKGPELMNKFVGESERAVRQLFTRAKTSSPCVVFFDELDALCPRRGDASSSRVSERIVNQLLVELDGFDSGEEKIFVIGATNRIDIIDPAMLRPGRLEKLVYVDLPDQHARAEIFKTQARNISLAPDVDLTAVAADSRCQQYTGADSAALLREAGNAAIWRLLQENNQDFDKTAAMRPAISTADLEVAMRKVKPSVSKRDLARYRRVADEFSLRESSASRQHKDADAE
ncbi:hypothetical protein PTSG_09399 [Salpingoeca rosetta]|uniref:AAA+ ATPase domain-containing protein n=1 Tax=Salpingoeca rosetta (strain ATCC 50818 / BSB-021) TaxID=946362 RepID=F2UMI4_SALR5|nr:uncharacterized protein PTSG_09399 [Salpingoeca rosetta]EGD78333.1 hypothetical protein PTSG_09399 [Salpingoeca rosetta]|eukprot:XP_004989656.1 hypothetical protein PTSG_09399 [Salpingoeca rosetta]